jgi:hypothetical protein
MSRTAGIATIGGRSSKQKTPRRTTYLDPKGGKELPVNLTPGVRLDHGPMANEAIQGHECEAYVALYVWQ